MDSPQKTTPDLLGKFLAVTTELTTNNGRAARYCYVQDFYATCPATDTGFTSNSAR